MTWANTFWLRIYEYRPYLRALQQFLAFMVMLTAISFVLGQPGTGSYSLAAVNLCLILVFGGVVTAMSWYSARRRARQ